MEDAGRMDGGGCLMDGEYLMDGGYLMEDRWRWRMDGDGGWMAIVGGWKD